MRNMSFALTTRQIVDGSKTVTRRLGWLKTKRHDWIQPVRKCMGLRPGEKIEKIMVPIMVRSARREPLCLMIDDPAYGRLECVAEGFPDMSPEEFVEMFCDTHRGCLPHTVVTRIEFWPPMMCDA